MRTTVQNAQLALLLEVCGTPKPGNVDRHRDLDGLWFEHFMAGAIGSQQGLEQAANGASIGTALERAVRGMANQQGGNAQFGALCLLVPLVRAAKRDLSQPVCEAVAEETTVSDAAAFYRSFQHVDVYVADPPPGIEALDVRRGPDAIPTLEAEGLTLYDIMELSASGDDVAREWVTGFERSFVAAERLVSANGPVADRAATTFLSLLGDRPDTLIVDAHGEDIARKVCERAAELDRQNALSTDPAKVDEFANKLVSRGINPGTTADITAAGLFIALEHDVITV